MRRFAITTIIIIAFHMSGCGLMVGDDQAVSALTSQGFTKVAVSERHYVAVGFYGCGEGDAVAFKCSAINSKGNHTEVTVCCGWPFKGCTIRY
ncbi:MAG: hypothetical protein GY854_19700 [Deltaproteobacteria bacterium]|nr:hypothetical protein [Deltaproteobacteria bacterium]